MKQSLFCGDGESQCILDNGEDPAQAGNLTPELANVNFKEGLFYLKLVTRLSPILFFQLFVFAAHTSIIWLLAGSI